MGMLGLLPFPIGSSPSGADLFQVTGVRWDCAIGGIPFMLDTTSTPIERATRDYRVEQFDNAREPGEQSLTGWWLRSQSRFDSGAGVTYYEPLLGDGSERRFFDSVGVDVFTTPGKVEPSKHLESVDTTGVGTIRGLAEVDGKIRILGSTAFADLEPTGITVGSAPPSGAVGITSSSDGTVWVGATDAIYKDGVSTYTYSGAGAQVWYAKNRLFAAFDKKLYELNPAGSGALSGVTPLSIPQSWDNDPTWTWVAVDETPGAVWAAGVDGFDQGRVFVITLDDTDSTVVYERAVLPRGERILTAFGYLGFLILGTTEGVRVCPTAGDDLALGPAVGGLPVYGLTAYGTSVYAATMGSHDGYTGVVRVDLSEEVEEGRYAYAKESYSSSLEQPVVVSVLPGTSRIVLATTNSLFLQSTTTLSPSAWLETGITRWGVLENKWFGEVDVFGDFTGGSLLVATKDERGNLYPQRTVSATTFSSIKIGQPSSPVRGLGLRFTFTPGAVGELHLGGYQLRGLPTPKKRRLFRLPLRVTSSVRDRFGAAFGREGFAEAQQFGLERLEEIGRPVMFQDFRTGETRRVQIESLRHVQAFAPDGKYQNAEGFTLAELAATDALQLGASDFTSAG